MSTKCVVAQDRAVVAEGLLIGESRSIREVRRLVGQVGPSNASVLITGPSGSGKEMVARALHGASRRSASPYVAINCGAIPRELLESELFGHEKGAFTGAHAQHRGRFEEANGGTLFLDEIGDMPLDMQVKLLRVLEERAVQRVGGRGQIAVDARIVSATHRDIDLAIDEQRFREDLFYRLAVFPIELPGLAERAEDVLLLVRHFLAQAGDRGAAPRFNAAALDRLARHGWPGNVRELRNLVERSLILFPGQTMGAEQVETLLIRRRRAGAAELRALSAASEMLPAPAEVQKPAPCGADQQQSESGAPLLVGDAPVDLKALIATFENRYISEALERSGGIVAEAARMLSLQRTTLIEKMRKYELARAG
jgi:sigma-54 dependent transcriptional regulator, flagellar regulatory protein